MLVPLALAQFICSFAGSIMNVMINDISKDLDTTVQGVQTAVIAAIVLLSRKLVDPLPPDPTRPFDTAGAILSAAGMLLVVVGILFVVSVFLQTVRGYNAIQTGLIFTAATVGILVSSLAAERLAGRRAPKRP